MTLLSLDTSTDSCSVALVADGVVAAHFIDTDHPSMARVLPNQIQSVLSYASDNHISLDGVALSCGPGSYTGLRIGASFAKGLCYGYHIPLFPVPSLMLLCAGVLARSISPAKSDDVLLCPMIDARRMEVYTALYDTQCNAVMDIHPRVIENGDWLAPYVDKKILFFGNGAAKCRSVLSAQNFDFIEGIVPDAASVSSLIKLIGTDKIPPLTGSEMAYYEPLYLKNFIAAPSHIKGLQ